MNEYQDITIIRAVVELAEDRAMLQERVRRLERVNVELQEQLEHWKKIVTDLEGGTKH